MLEKAPRSFGLIRPKNQFIVSGPDIWLIAIEESIHTKNMAELSVAEKPINGIRYSKEYKSWFKVVITITGNLHELL